MAMRRASFRSLSFNLFLSLKSLWMLDTGASRLRENPQNSPQWTCAVKILSPGRIANSRTMVNTDRFVGPVCHCD